MSGDRFVEHELNHMDMHKRITKRQQIMSAGEFMVELKYPQKAKDSLQKEIDNATVTYVRPLWLFLSFSYTIPATKTILLAAMHLKHAMPLITVA